tara:strand:+ start:2555 stop:2944 length:390 start_codon:yes stop_codon:yes gene_type:complete
LQSHRHKRSILQECQQILSNPQFEQLLDSNPLLLGFDNGIFDLETQTFRPGRPEDFVHLTTGYNYIDMNLEELLEHHTFRMVHEAIKSAVPEEDRHNFLMRFCASLCQGGNSEGTFMCGQEPGETVKAK